MRKKFIFVDCFNTVICRKKSPEDVVLLWAKEMEKEFPTISADVFFGWFKSFELKIGQQNKLETGEVETTFDKILEEMCNAIEFYCLIQNFNRKLFLKRGGDFYSCIEKENQIVNQKTVKFLKKQKAQGCKIFMVSDFYCGKKVLSNWLDNLGVLSLFDEIFVSCDHNKSKGTGRMYQHIIKTLNLNKKDVLMVGDNVYVDIKMPRKMGIKAKRIFEKDKKRSKDIQNIKKPLYVPKVFEKIFHENGAVYNFSNYAFPLYVFIKRLANLLLDKKVEDVFFLSREGFFLKKLFDEYCKMHAIEIHSHHLAISRNSAFVASLKSLEEERFDGLLDQTPSFSLQRFLASLDFTEQQMKTIALETKIILNKEIHHFKSSKQFMRLKQNETFKSIYDLKRTNQGLAFKQYLNNFGVQFEKRGLYIVDVGWRGTIQDCIHKAFEGNVDVNGFYICFLGSGVSYDGNRKFGLLFSKNTTLRRLKKEGKIFKFQFVNYEQLLRAGTNRVVGYQMEKGKVKLTYDTKLDEKSIFENLISPMQKQIFDKFVDICKSEPQNFCCFESVATVMFLQTMANISAQDMNWLTCCKQSFYDCFKMSGYILKDEAAESAKKEQKKSKCFARKNLKYFSKKRTFYI